MPPRPLTRLRKLCLALPEACEVEAWGTPTFRVKTMFAMYAAADTHHGEGREGVWIRSTRTNQALMVQMAPDRFFVPPYVGPSGWVGVYLDAARTDWDELAEILRDAWRMSAPKKLVARVESGAPLEKPRSKGSSAAGSKRTARPTTKRTTKRATNSARKSTKKQGKRTTTRAR